MTTCGSHLDVSPGDELLLPAVPRVFPHVVRAVAGLTVAAAAHSAGVAVQLGDDLDDVGGAEGPGQRVPHLQHTLHSPPPPPCPSPASVPPAAPWSGPPGRRSGD